MKWSGINAVLCAVFALRLGGYLVSLLIAISPDLMLYGQYIEVCIHAVTEVFLVVEIDRSNFFNRDD